MRPRVGPPGCFTIKLLIDKEENMKKFIILILIAVFLMISFGCTTVTNNTPPGPAPNSGDGVSDGSGLDAPFGVEPTETPNSGDGISDGSGK